MRRWWHWLWIRYHRSAMDSIDFHEQSEEAEELFDHHWRKEEAHSRKLSLLEKRRERDGDNQGEV